MRFARKIKDDSSSVRPDHLEKRTFSSFAWLPKLFLNKTTNEIITIWLETVEIERTYFRKNKRRQDKWGNGTLINTELRERCF